MISGIEAFQIYKNCIAQWGETSQILMVIEELNELAVVLCHSLRANKPFDLDHIKEEMADVQIMLEQLKVILSISDVELSEERQKKLQRVKELL